MNLYQELETMTQEDKNDFLNTMEGIKKVLEKKKESTDKKLLTVSGNIEIVKASINNLL